MDRIFNEMDGARRRRDLALSPAKRLKAGFELSRKAFEMLGPGARQAFIRKQRAMRAAKLVKSP